MAWPKGKPRPSGAGRKPGTPNKATLPIEELCNLHNCSPVEILINLAIDPTDKTFRFQAAKELMQYLYPKRTASQITLDGYTPEQLLQAAEGKLNGSAETEARDTKEAN